MKSALAFLVGAALVAFVGCSGAKLESEVSGTVSLDGTPIGPGIVVFAPVGAQTNPATGSIEPNGQYSLRTSRTEGLKSGRYQVAVSAREAPANLKPGDRPPPGKLLTPAKYEQTTTSGLEFEVKPGSNTIDIELVSTDSK